MYIKAITFKNDQSLINQIMKSTSSATIKQLGSKKYLKKFVGKEWDLIKYQVMETGVYAKFSQIPELRKILLETGNKILVEASPYDSDWGIGFPKTDAMKNIRRWGSNNLGKILMKVRSRLRSEARP